MLIKEYTNSQIEHLIDEHIHSKRDRQILKLYFVDGLSAEQISAQKDIDLSVRWVYAIIKRAITVLSAYI